MNKYTMRLNDFNPRFQSTKNVAKIDEAAPLDKSLVKIPGMGVVHIEALRKNILEKLEDLTKLVSEGGPSGTISANKLINGPAFKAMFDALAKAYEDIERAQKK